MIYKAKAIKLIILTGIFFILGLSSQLLHSKVSAVDYYVDSVGGLDSNDGLTPGTPWQTLSKVRPVNFTPGDQLFLKSGSVFSEELFLDQGGSAGAVAKISSYGAGAKPIIDGGNLLDRGIAVNGPYFYIENLEIRNIKKAAVDLYAVANNTTVRNMTITNSGFGVNVTSSRNTITGNNISNLKMIKNTPDISGDDFGAVAINLDGGDAGITGNIISYNTFRNCEAPSYDYGTDGGGIEFYKKISNTTVRHNRVEDSAMFAEMGGTGQSQNSNYIYRNLSINNGQFLIFHYGNGKITPSNFYVDNNTVYNSSFNLPIIYFFTTSVPANTLILRNNILTIHTKISDANGFTRSNNVYYVKAGSGMGYTLGAGEMVGSPSFTNEAGKNFHIQDNSIARNAGVAVNWITSDFDGNTVSDGMFDIGAYENKSVVPPTNTPVPTTTEPTPTLDPSSPLVPSVSVTVSIDPSITPTGLILDSVTPTDDGSVTSANLEERISQSINNIIGLNTETNSPNYLPLICCFVLLILSAILIMLFKRRNKKDLANKPKVSREKKPAHSDK